MGDVGKEVASRHKTSSPIDSALMQAKVSNQAPPPSAAEAEEGTTNSVLECGKAFPGSKATFDEILKWRQHPGWKPDNDPFLNGQIKGGEPQPPSKEDEEWEKSRLLDECMRDVYRHLHDALVDETYNGQELKLGRAYTAITKFQMEHTGQLTQMQTASLACTRDQVAQLQCDLSTRAARLDVSVAQLEQSFKRIDKDARESHAKFVAAQQPKGPVVKKLSSGIEVNVSEVVAQIEALARANKGFGDKGLWFGLDYSMLCMNGELSSLDKNPRFILCKTEEQWKKLEPSFAPMQLVASGQKLPGENEFFSELTHVRHDGLQLVVQYFVVELDDRRHENPVHNDPRAQLLPEVLSGKSFQGQAIVQVWAHIKQLDKLDKPREAAADGMAERKAVGEPHEEHDAPRAARSPSPQRRRPSASKGGSTGDIFGNVDSDNDSDNVQWSEAIDPAQGEAGVSTLRHEADKLMQRAKAVADLGDHKSAYELAAQGHTLRQKADSIEDAASSVGASPAEPEPKVYKPEVKYEYPSGEVRVIEAGYYTESGHLSKSMYEQDLLSAVKTATAAGIEKAKLSPDQMSKYESPLARSESQAEAITNAEKLAPAVADKAGHAREVLRTSREVSKQSSPVESPTLANREGHPLPKDSITFKLPEDVLTAAERELCESLPLPKSLQPGSALFAPSREALLNHVSTFSDA
jgi:hypothetical protein